MRLSVIILPFVFFSLLAAGGCTRVKTAAPPPPGGVYLSSSAGANFDQSVMLAGGEGHIAALPLQHAVRPSFDTSKIYIAAGASGIVSSGDGGHSWSLIPVPLTVTSDIVPLSNGVLVATGTDASGQGYVVRTIDQGKSWETTLTIPLPSKKQGFQLFKTNDAPAAVVISIAADPFRADRLYGGTNLGSILVGEQSGKTWRTLTTLSSLSGASALAISGLVPSPHRADELLVVTTGGTLHRLSGTADSIIKIKQDLSGKADNIYSYGGAKLVRSAAFIKSFPQALLAGTDDGAIFSRDAGVTWQQLNLPVDAAKGFSTAVVATSPSNSSRMFVGLNNVLYRSEDGGQNWNTFPFQAGGRVITSILIDPANAANVVVVTSLPTA